jgi:hypothetical protein
MVKEGEREKVRVTDCKRDIKKKSYFNRQKEGETMRKLE